MKKSSKKRERSKKDKRLVIAKANAESDEVRDNPFDFGGLPPRDLKKNIGCG
jgi:hypothetical protein